MNPYDVFNTYCSPQSEAYDLLLAHSEAVKCGALAVAERLAHLTPDLSFIEEAALLHDIGIVQTHAPAIGCDGTQPYLAHGHLGAKMLNELNYPRHARVCERHIGLGLTRVEIEAKELPLPLYDVLPVSLEEKIICYVDNFFSKGSSTPTKPISTESVRRKVSSFGTRSLVKFDEWFKLFGLPE